MIVELQVIENFLQGVGVWHGFIVFGGTALARSRAKSKESGHPQMKALQKGKRSDRAGDDVSVNDPGQGFDLNSVTLLTAGIGIRLNTDQGLATILGPFVSNFPMDEN